jgi:predicted metal-dependent phosphoesterase TrpH
MSRLKIQLHSHTKQDPRHDIKHTEKELINEAARLGYHALAITCQDVLIFNEDLKKYAEEKRILLIPGIEKRIGPKNKHVIILNAAVESQNIKSFEDLVAYKNKHPECFIMAPHPYYGLTFSLGKELENNIQVFDAIEYSWYHTKRINRWNKKAVDIAEKNSLPVICTSDNQFIKYFDYSYSIIEADKNIESVFKSLKSKEIKIVSRNLSLVQFFFIIPFKVGISAFIKYFTLR